MYRLITFEYSPLIQNPFFPTFLLNGAPAQGMSHGLNLTMYPEYGSALIELIIECLYENPQHRPTLLALKTRISDGFTAITNKGQPHDVAEDWTSFFSQPPPPAPVGPPPSQQCTWMHVKGAVRAVPGGPFIPNGQGHQCLRRIRPTVLNNMNGLIRCPAHNYRLDYP
jgi:hypothetical protein